jgi:hypothetical protein
MIFSFGSRRATAGTEWASGHAGAQIDGRRHNTGRPTLPAELLPLGSVAIPAQAQIPSDAPLHVLLDEAVLEVGDARSLEHPDLFELDAA